MPRTDVPRAAEVRGAAVRGLASSKAAQRTTVLQRTAWILAVAIPLTFFAIFFAYPVGAIVARGFIPDGAGDLSSVADVLGDGHTWRVVGRTLGQAALGTLGSVVLAIPGAYLLYRRAWPGRGVIRGLVAVPFVLPTVVVGVAFRSLLGPGGPLEFLGWDRSLAAVVAALIFFNYGLVVRLVGTVWERLDPRQEQAARVLGASSARAWWTVTLPALAPAIASAAALVFLFCSTAFALVLTLGGQRQATLEVEIWLQTTQFLDLPTAAVLSVLQLIIVAAALMVSARMRARRERALHLMESRATVTTLRLGPSTSTFDWVAVGITTFALLGLIAPLATMLVRSLRTPDGWGWDNYAALTTTGTNALTVPVWQAAANSVRIAVDATLIAMTIGVLLAVVLSRRPRSAWGRRGSAWLDAAMMLPLGVSAVTVGFGFLIALDRPPFDLRSSLILIPIAQAMVAIPLVVRTVLPVLRAIDPRLRDAAAVLGASPGRVLATVDLPLSLRSIGLATGMAFAVSLGEFGATSFLARPDRPTLPVVIYRLLGRPGEGNYEMALAASVVLAVGVGIVMVTAERLRPARAGEW